MNTNILIGPFHNVDVAQEELQNKNKINIKFNTCNKTENKY